MRLSQFQAIRARGYDLCIVGTQDMGIARTQIARALQAGFNVHAYAYLYWAKPVEPQIDEALAIIAGYPVRRLWLDVEDDSSGVLMVNTLRRAVDRCGTMPRGIYTSASKWQEIMGDSAAFSGEPLWDAWFGHEQIGDFAVYGGWSRCEMRQYQGTTTLEGVNVDLNVYRK